MVNRIDYQQYVPTDSLNRQRNEQVNQISNQIKEQVQDKTGTIVAENQNDISKEQVQDMVERLNVFLTPLDTSLKFEFHEELNEYYVTIVDNTSNEVIKEIPPKKMLDLYAAMVERMGLFIDKKI